MMIDLNRLNRALYLNGIDTKIVPFNNLHLKVMDFRSYDRTIIDSFINYDDLTKNLNGNGLSFTGIKDNKFACCFGVVPIWHGVAECWLLPSKDISSVKFIFHKSSLLFFDYIMNILDLHRLQITVLKSNKIAYKWAKKCYFVEEGLLRKYGPDKNDYILMSRIREKE